MIARSISSLDIAYPSEPASWLSPFDPKSTESGPLPLVSSVVCFWGYFYRILNIKMVREIIIRGTP